LQELYQYAWDTFYKEESQQQKMFNLIMKVIDKEVADGTYVSPRRDLAHKSFGRNIR
jgi:hypothetical protein